MLCRGDTARRGVLATAMIVLALGLPAAAAPGPARAAGFPPIRHVFVIVLENKDYYQTFQAYNSSDPYLSRTLPSMGALIPYYFGTGHSSLDNYVAMVSGQPPTADTKNDCEPAGASNEVGTASDSYGVAQTGGCWYPAKFTTVADQLVHAGFTWRAYNEGMNGNCAEPSVAGGSYKEKHNPFPYFQSLLDSGQCSANDVPLYPAADTAHDVAGSALGADLQSPATTPNFAFITPNQCSDGHDDCTSSSSVPESPQQTQDQLAQEDSFLKKWVPAILGSPAYRQDGMLVITTDEGGVSPTGASSCCSEPATDPDGTPPGGEGSNGFYSPGPGGGQVGAVVLSPYVTAGTQSNACYNHYSLLHTVEDLFGLPYLAEAAKDNSNQPGGVTSFGSDVFTATGGAGAASGPGPGTGPTCEITAPLGVTSPSGPSGPTGPSGPSGPSGPTGPSGPSGSSGPSGPGGPSGSGGPGSGGSGGSGGSSGSGGSGGPGAPGGGAPGPQPTGPISGPPPGPAGPGGSQGQPAPRRNNRSVEARLRLSRCHALYRRSHGRRRLAGRGCVATLQSANRITGTWRATLERGQVVYATGSFRGMRLQLIATRRITAGQYQLTLRRANQSRQIPIGVA